jgi:hypothetical protein
MNTEYERQFQDAEFSEAIRALKGLKYALTHAQLAQLADVMCDKTEEMDGLHGLNRVVDEAAMLKVSINLCYAPPEQLSVYGERAKDIAEVGDDN